MRINLRHDLDSLAARLTDLERRQLPFAVARALTRTASAARAKLVEEFPRLLDRPTPFIARSPRFQRATKANQQAVVFLGETASRVLDLLIRGGGVRLPGSGRQALIEPGGRLRLDRYGNVPRTAARRPRAAEAANTFVGLPKGHPGAPAGIWQRYGRRPRLGSPRKPDAPPQTARIRLLLGFRPQQVVRKSLPFYEMIQALVVATIRDQINRSLAEAVDQAERQK